MAMFWSGLAKRASREAAWADVGDRARFLVGRRERGSAEVGMEEGPGADMPGCWVVVLSLVVRVRVRVFWILVVAGWLFRGRMRPMDGRGEGVLDDGLFLRAMR